MKRRALGALAARIVRGFRHDRRTLALLVIVPLVVMALIGYMLSDDREPLRVAVADGESNETCGAIVSDTATLPRRAGGAARDRGGRGDHLRRGHREDRSRRRSTGSCEYPVIGQGDPDRDRPG